MDEKPLHGFRERGGVSKKRHPDGEHQEGGKEKEDFRDEEVAKDPEDRPQGLEDVGQTLYKHNV